jgi:hypothetical protein
MSITEVVTNCDHLAKLKYSPTLPYAFTEHGALMLGNVLKSDRAIEAIHQLMTPAELKKKRPIGFAPWEKK